MIFLLVLLLLMSALLILAWSLMLTSLLLMLTRCLIQCFIHFVGSLVYMPVTRPVRVHLLPRRRRSTFLLYLHYMLSALSLWLGWWQIC